MEEPPHTPPAATPDPLAFTPVPRRLERVDGWTPDHQRAFIAALAETGSPRRAAAAVNRSAFGAEQLRKAAGAGGSSAAWDAALALFADRERALLAEGVDAVAGKAAIRSYFPPSRRGSLQIRPGTGRGASHSQRRRLVEGPAKPESSAHGQPDDREEPDDDWGQVFLRKYLVKLHSEHEARHAGKTAAADFYLRQLTHIEVMLDLAGSGLMEAFRDFRHEDVSLLDIAETPFSKLLDDVRRIYWKECDEPPRPGPIPRDLLVDEGGFSTEPTESISGDTAEDRRALQERFDMQHGRDAKEQVRWEAQARRDYESRREASQTHNQEPRPAGRPAPEG